LLFQNPVSEKILRKITYFLGKVAFEVVDEERIGARFRDGFLLSYVMVF